MQNQNKSPANQIKNIKTILPPFLLANSARLSSIFRQNFDIALYFHFRYSQKSPLGNNCLTKHVVNSGSIRRLQPEKDGVTKFLANRDICKGLGADAKVYILPKAKLIQRRPQRIST